MHPANWPRILAALLLGAALASLITAPAAAEPTTAERRRVAEEVAAGVCRTAPSIPKLPASVSLNKLCRSVVVENVDPEGDNSGLHAACIAALPVFAKPAARFCAAALDKLLDPARELFLDKVVPAAENLKCITSTPAAFDCLAKQIHIWLEQSIITLWQGLLTVLTADTEVIDLLEDWRNPGIVRVYSDIGTISVIILLGVLLTSLIVSAIRFDFRQFGSSILGVIVWGLFWSGGVTVAVLLLKASDAMARWLAGRPNRAGETDLTRAGRHFASWVEYVSGGSPVAQLRPSYQAGSFTAILVCLLLIIAIVATLVALLMRNVALLLIIMALPLSLAGTAGLRLTRHWFVAAVRLFVALLLAKPLIVIAVRVGAVLVSVPSRGEPKATFSDALLGVAIILLAALLPGVIYRFSGGLMNTSAGQAPRSSGGLTSQTSQSVVSSMDTTRMIMERNAPRPAVAAAPGSTARSTSAAPGGRAVAVGAGSVAGPVGIAAMATALAGGALESGGRWLGGHAATGGGVFGDVEGPAVPAPPVSRVPRRSQPTSAAQDQHPQHQAHHRKDRTSQHHDRSAIVEPEPAGAPAAERSTPDDPRHRCIRHRAARATQGRCSRSQGPEQKGRGR